MTAKKMAWYCKTQVLRVTEGVIKNFKNVAEIIERKIKTYYLICFLSNMGIFRNLLQHFIISFFLLDNSAVVYHILIKKVEDDESLLFTIAREQINKSEKKIKNSF